VFIHGPNAAIDTADIAKFQKFKVVWLVKKGVDVPLLATGHQVYAANAVQNDVKRYPAVARRTPAFTVTVAPGALNQVSVKIGKEVIWGTLYVYGMGQDPEEAMKGVIPPKLRKQLVQRLRHQSAPGRAL
jgi:VCBS repeat-containing protein